MLEIGVGHGGSTRALLNAAAPNDGCLTSIDIDDCAAAAPEALRRRWSFHFLDEVYRQEQFIHHPCWENVAIIELLNKEAVREDLRLWYPNVRSGSVFAGHSFLDSNPPDFHFGVRRAVVGIRASARGTRRGDNRM